MTNNKGKLQQKLSLFSNDAVDLLREAVTKAQEEEAATAAIQSTVRRAVLPRYQESSDEEEDHESAASSSSDESSDEHQGEKTNATRLDATSDKATFESSSHIQQQLSRRQQRLEKPTMDTKQRSAAILRHDQNLACIALPINNDNTTAVYFPTSLLSKQDKAESPNRLVVAQAALTLANALNQDRVVIILCIRSGRFAGAVYLQNQCLEHKTSQRYTVRKGQGKAQSAQDGNRRPKSMGAQLRRAGEQKLKHDIWQTLQQWQTFIDRAALVLVSCPKTMLKDVFVQEGSLVKTDPRIRRVPMDVGRPTFEAVGLIYSVMTCLTVREYQPETDHIHEVEVEASSGAEANGATLLHSPLVVDESESESALPQVPLTPLHIAARNGDIEILKTLLQSNDVSDCIDSVAGEFLMTPLHYAAQAHANVSTAADCVYELLVTGHANPCVVDSRNRVPWFLADNDKVREAFRKARAELGEDYCDWNATKVAEPLTDQDLQHRKEVEAEKRRKKKARQKQKKAEEKAVEEARAQQQREEAERQKEEEEAKRIRDGLQPKKSTATNVCDFCQTSKKALRRSDMFKRLDYVYCSTDCVQKHKRELMAAAAMKRLEA